MPGNLTLEALDNLVRRGDIDTVLVTFPDMQGRLMGKRVTAPFFLEQVARSGMHACAYLLTVDVDMTPLPGYRSASWVVRASGRRWARRAGLSGSRASMRAVRLAGPVARPATARTASTSR